MKVRRKRSLKLSDEECWFAGAMMALAVICWIVALICRTRLGLDFEPYKSPLFDEHFPDLLLFRDRFRSFHSPAFFTYPNLPQVMYPAPVAVVYKVFYLIAGSHPVWFFCGLALAVFATAGVLFARGLARRGMALHRALAFTIIVLATSYPIWFDLKQANLEIVVWVLLASGVAFFCAERDLLAALCFSLAACMKIYPVVFLGLLLLRRRYQALLIGLGAAALVQVFSLWLECPPVGFASQQTRANLDLFRTIFMLHLVKQAEMDHSLFCLFKRMLSPLPPTESLNHMLTVYLAISAVFGCVVLFGVLRKLPLANQVLGLTIFCVLLPPTSFEYTLLHLLTPAALLLLLDTEARANGGRLRGLGPTLICLTVLLGAIPEIIRHGIRLEGSIKAIMLVLLLGICLKIPFVVVGARSLENGRESDCEVSEHAAATCQ